MASATNLKITPAIFTAMRQGHFEKIALSIAANLESRAKVSEGERDAPAPSPWAVDFHDRQRFLELVIGEAAEIDRLVAVSVVKDARPWPSVKEGSFGMIRQQQGPTGVPQWIGRAGSRGASASQISLRFHFFHAEHLKQRIHVSGRR